MPFKVEEVVSGVDMKRVHVIYRLEKIKNVGIANMTEEEARAAIGKVIAELKSQATTEIMQDLGSTPEEAPPEVPVEEAPTEVTTPEIPAKTSTTPGSEEKPEEVTTHE